MTGEQDSVIAKIDQVIRDAKRDGRWSVDHIRYKQAERDIKGK